MEMQPQPIPEAMQIQPRFEFVLRVPTAAPGQVRTEGFGVTVTFNLPYVVVGATLKAMRDFPHDITRCFPTLDLRALDLDGHDVIPDDTTLVHFDVDKALVELRMPHDFALLALAPNYGVEGLLQNPIPPANSPASSDSIDRLMRGMEVVLTGQMPSPIQTLSEGHSIPFSSAADPQFVVSNSSVDSPPSITVTTP